MTIRWSDVYSIGFFHVWDPMLRRLWISSTAILGFWNAKQRQKTKILRWEVRHWDTRNIKEALETPQQRKSSKLGRSWISAQCRVTASLYFRSVVYPATLQLSCRHWGNGAGQLTYLVASFQPLWLYGAQLQLWPHIKCVFQWNNLKQPPPAHLEYLWSKGIHGHKPWTCCMHHASTKSPPCSRRRHLA